KRDGGSSLAAKGFGESDQFICYDFGALDDFFVGNVVAVEGVGGGENEPGNNHATKIEHETVRIGHNRHITASAASRAKEADDLVFPRAAGEFDHVFRRGGDIIIVYRRRDQDPVRSFNCGA